MFYKFSSMRIDFLMKNISCHFPLYICSKQCRSLSLASLCVCHLPKSDFVPCICILCISIRDAPIAIFLADSDFWFLGSVTCRYRFLPILIFFLRTIIDSIHKQKSMQISTKNDLLKINYHPIWTNLHIFSHLTLKIKWSVTGKRKK